MIGPVFAILLFAFCQMPQEAPQNSAPSPEAVQTSAKPEPQARIEKARILSKVRRIFVDDFGTDPISQQMQAMVVSSLTESDRFTVTEDKSKADAILKGVATERTSQELHAYGSGTAVGTAHGGSHASVSGTGGTFSGSAGGGFGAEQTAIQDSSANTETIDNAHAAVRLVDKDGDIIWTTTQESAGAKFKGASADVADKIAKQLLRDAERADSMVNDRPASK